MKNHLLFYGSIIAFILCLFPSVSIPVIGTLSVFSFGWVGKVIILSLILIAISEYYSTYLEKYIVYARIKKYTRYFILIGILGWIVYVWYTFSFPGSDIRDNPFLNAMSMGMGVNIFFYLLFLVVVFLTLSIDKSDWLNGRIALIKGHLIK